MAQSTLWASQAKWTHFPTAKAPGEQPGTCVPPLLHHNLPYTVRGAVAITHKDNLQQPKLMCRCDISLSAGPGLFVQHTALTFHQDFGDFCVAGTEGTVQLEPVGVVKKGSTQGKQHFLGFNNKNKVLGKKAHENQLVIFASTRSHEVFI